MKTSLVKTAIVAAIMLVIAGCTAAPSESTASATATASASPAAPDDREPQERLVDAVLSSNVGLATSALATGADPNLVDDDTANNPLSLAITRDDVAMVQVLLDAGAQVEFDDTGFTMLSLAAEFAGGPVAQAMLDTGADPNGLSQTDVNGNEVSYGAPLFTASTGGNVEVMDVLLQAGARTDLVLTFGPYTVQPLGAAAYGGHMEAVDLLLTWGADPSWAGPDGLTAADMASAQNHVDIYAYLRELER
jgi:ankyrin repeat protein